MTIPISWFLMKVVIWFSILNQVFCLNVSIGVLFKEISAEAEIPLNTIVNTYSRIKQTNIQYDSKIRQISYVDIKQTQKAVCNIIDVAENLVAIFDTKTSITSPIVKSICSHVNVPYILTSWQQTFHDNSNSLNFYPDAYLFSKAVAEMVRSLDWAGFYILYEKEESLLRLQEVLKLQRLRHASSTEYVGLKRLVTGTDQRMVLKTIGNVTSKIILDCNTENILPILQQAKELDMLNDHYSYFLTSPEAHTVNISELHATANITSMRLFQHDSAQLKTAVQFWKMQYSAWFGQELDINYSTIETQTALFHDALTMLTAAIDNLEASGTSISRNYLSCDEEDLFFESGPVIIDTMKKLKNIKTLTGPIKFDENGNRIDFTVYIYNHRNNSRIATWFQSNNSLLLSRTVEEAAIITLHENVIKVATRLGVPFLMEVFPNEGLHGNDRFKGYSRDLMDKIAEYHQFTYEFFLTEDKEYGKWDHDKNEWTGLVGDILKKKAHLAICDLTATHERQSVVDFSQAFMTLGISVLHKYEEKTSNNFFIFLEPFAPSLWMYIATLYLAVSTIFYFVARMTPGDWNSPHPCVENPTELEFTWGVGNTHWVTLGSIMNQGCDILPKGISSRVVVAMWWMFALIITNSYTATLTSFLTKGNQQHPLKNVEELAKQHKIKYGLMKGGSTETFFRDSNVSLYRRMYEKMKSEPNVFVTDNTEGVRRVLNSEKATYAFLMESTQIDYQTESNCVLRKVGNWLDTKNYGIAMPINAPYRGLINQAILHFQENGELDRLKTKWWKTENYQNISCYKGFKTDGDKSLSLEETAGIFLVLGLGVCLACILGMLEFLWHVNTVSVDEHVSYWEALKIETKFACNVWVTKKRVKPTISESSSSSCSKIENRSILQSILHGANSLVHLNLGTHL